MRKKAQICRTVCLAAWLIFLYYLYRLCRLGGVRNYIVPLAVSFLIVFASGVFWIFFHVRARKSEDEKGTRSLFWAELLIFLAGSFYFGGQIVYSAIPYHGALSWKLDEWAREKEIVLEHDNLFLDGVEGILSDLDEVYGLPDELYISNVFQLTLDGDGEIQTVDTFIYGKNEEGETESFLIDYDRGRSEKMTVWADGQVSDTYDPDMKLGPMQSILQEADYKEQIKNWKQQFPGKDYEILYYGRRSFSSAEGLKYLSGDVDGDGKAEDKNYLELLENGGELIGYEVSLHIPGMDNEVTPVRYMMEPEYRSVAATRKEQEESQIDESKNVETWSVDQTDGTMYFFLTESAGWRLYVIDAAAGSRFYGLEKTEDGGRSWTSCCENPFNGNGGVAAGLRFFDETYGFASLSGASQSHAALYVTRDGGETFTELQMPVDTVTELPDIAAKLGYTAEDYDYLCMPEQQNGILTVVALTGAGETDGILYQSEDKGETWHWIGVQ